MTAIAVRTPPSKPASGARRTGEGAGAGILTLRRFHTGADERAHERIAGK